MVIMNNFPCFLTLCTTPSLLMMQEGITVPMTMQENRITDLQKANVVLIRGLESAKEEAEILRQELSNSMETKEDINALLMDLETSRKNTVQYETKVGELQVGSSNTDDLCMLVTITTSLCNIP